MKKSIVICIFVMSYAYGLEKRDSSDMPPTDMMKKHQDAQPNIKPMWAAVRESLGSIDLLDGKQEDTKKIPAVAPGSTTSKESVAVNNIISAEVSQVTSHQPTTSVSVTNHNDTPSQMAPIEKGLAYIRPKANERWILNEEGTIKWAISSYLESKADKILMNCDLYLEGTMIMSVFKGVPLNIGIESWTPPTFLEASPRYRLRLWSQPSPIGIIDQYSAMFIIVPKKEDAFMFQYKSVVFDNGSNNKTAAPAPTDKIKIDQNDTPAPSISIKHGAIIDVNASPSSIDPNMPTGIYALYPSNASKFTINTLNTLIIGTLFVCYMIQ